MKPLPSPVVTAAMRISAAAHPQTLSFLKLREIVQANPVAVWHEYATFHVEQTIRWEDGKEDTSHVATLNGCESELHIATCLMLLLRGEAQHLAANPHIKVRKRFRVVLSVPNNVNGLHGWLDCETGKLQTGKGWPHLLAAMAGKPADKSVRAPVEDAA